MKIRPLILIILLVGAFVYLTSYSNFRSVPGAPLARLWRQSPMHLTEADAQPETAKLFQTCDLSQHRGLLSVRVEA